ncbi:hypothetical protein NE865_10567 [Phthorimaea operculella]|nr:hypothetical protein NE865_10567 [Phthorimaea operculella]
MKPAKSSSPLEKSGSEPNLNEIKIPRKRKTMDDDMDELFKKLSLDFSTKINAMSTSLESKINAIQTDINTVIKSDLERINTKLSVIDINQSQLFADMETVKKSIEFQEGQHKDLATKVDGISSSSSTHGADIASMQSQIIKLQYDLNDQQQRDRAFNLELTGIPERTREDLSGYYCNIVKHLQVQSTASDIVHITRIRPVKPVPGRPKAIVVKLLSRSIRDSILAAVRAKKGLMTSDIGISGEPKKVYVNEHLTPANKLLHKQTREKAVAAQYRYVWVRDGKIFARKNDTSATVRISNSVDLRKLV